MLCNNYFHWFVDPTNNILYCCNYFFKNVMYFRKTKQKGWILGRLNFL